MDGAFRRRGDRAGLKSVPVPRRWCPIEALLAFNDADSILAGAARLSLGYVTGVSQSQRHSLPSVESAAIGG